MSDARKPSRLYASRSCPSLGAKPLGCLLFEGASCRQAATALLSHRMTHLLEDLYLKGRRQDQRQSRDAPLLSRTPSSFV